MSNGSQFTAQIAAFIAKANGNADLVFRKIALDMFSRVIQKSPVDTGRFKSNWQVAIGSAPTGTLGGTSTGLSSKLAEVTITGVTDNGGSVIDGLRAGEIIYLVNNLAYARALEYGYSKQAPNGMVRLTLLEYSSVVGVAAAGLPK